MGLAKWVKLKTRKIVHGDYEDYDKARKKPILNDACLFEGGQGSNIHGNMFALARELSWNPRYSGYRAIFVTTAETDIRARKKLAIYGVRAETVIRESPQYREYLARCKYLFTDNSFPTYLEKREEQVYVNTWHGTPLKQLGHSNIKNSIVSFGNIQKNMLTADYVLFPNELAKSCFFDDYKLRMLFANKVIMADYPRNDSLSDKAIAEVVTQREGLAGKRIVAYMPTWRGAFRTVNIVKQVEDLRALLTELDALLPDDVVLYVNLHFLLANSLKMEGFSHIRDFPPDYETYDFLAACDVLVTDYSSVFFDFAVTGRKIVLFPYDKDEYLSEVGTYIDYDALPFPSARTVKELAREIADCSYDEYAGFQDEYCHYHSGRASADLLETVCSGSGVLEAYENPDRRPVKVRFVKGFAKLRVNETVRGYLNREWPDDGLLVFMGGAANKNALFLEELDNSIAYLSVTSYRALSPMEKLSHAVARRSSVGCYLLKGYLRKAFKSELHRLMPGVEIDEVLLYAPEGEHFTYVLGAADCSKFAYVKHYKYLRRRRRSFLEPSFYIGDYEVVEPPTLPREVYDEDGKRLFYNDWIDSYILTRHCANSANGLGLRGVMLVRTLPEISAGHFELCLAGGLPVGKLRAITRVGATWVVSYEMHISADDAVQLPTQNAVHVVYDAGDGFGGVVRIQYGILDIHQSARKHTRSYIDEGRNTTMFFRHSQKNQLYLTIRQINGTDYLSGKLRVLAGFCAAKVFPARDAIVLYEKNASRYEESASVVYEKLLDKGYDNARFILDKSYRHYEAIGPQYRGNIVDKGSVEHFRLFFSAKAFIGSEMIAHCAEISTSSDMIATRLNSRKINYVFLQHGVMYMVSLDSESRKFFKPRNTTTGKYRVVTSSEAEKRHFVDRGQYDEEMLYVCGLPKFDRNTWDENADAIVVMPTWRPWEANLARVDFRNTGYYRLLEDMVKAVPEGLRSKLVVLAHPLFQQYIGDEAFPIRDYLDTESRYDDVLRRAKLLITDYSSIAYDAFYRGANVVFYWADKDECMEEYGPSTTLMIDEDTAFGDTCFTVEELRGCIEAAYGKAQCEHYVNRYRNIVQFHDGNNTERLVELLENDGII